MASDEELITKADTPPFFLSARFLLAIIFFLAVAIQYTHKTDISVGIVCMVNHTALKPDTNESFNPHIDEDNDCLFQPDLNKTDSDRVRTTLTFFLKSKIILFSKIQ